MTIEGKEIVMLSKQDYDKMVELAEMNQQQIETMAVGLWRKKGAAELKVTMEIRSNSGRSIVDNEQFRFVADCFIYNNEGKFFIPGRTKERFSKMVGDWTYELMRHEFGDKLMDANKYNKKVDDIEKERRKFAIFTIIGWLMAFAMFATVLLLTFK